MKPDISLETRERVELQREAFVVGATWASCQGDPAWLHGNKYAEAAKRYPFTEKKPRVITVDGMMYRYVNGKLEFATVNGWLPSTDYQQARLQGYERLRELINNPTEDVNIP